MRSESERKTNKFMTWKIFKAIVCCCSRAHRHANVLSRRQAPHTHAQRTNSWLYLVFVLRQGDFLLLYTLGQTQTPKNKIVISQDNEHKQRINKQTNERTNSSSILTTTLGVAISIPYTMLLPLFFCFLYSRTHKEPIPIFPIRLMNLNCKRTKPYLIALYGHISVRINFIFFSRKKNWTISFIN